MEFKDYKKEVEEDVKKYIKENIDYIKKEELYDDLFLADSVTGNASGSYTFNTYKAEENVKDLIWDDEFIDELRFQFGEEIGDLIKRGPEVLDVTARCLALAYVDIDSLYDEIKKESEEEDD